MWPRKGKKSKVSPTVVRDFDDLIVKMSYEDGYNRRGGSRDGRGGGGGGGSGDAGKIFVGGLNRETTDDELKNYFASFGVVTECVVKRDPNTGASRGFGFVSFSDPVAVDHVLAESAHVLRGKNIDPKRAKARTGNEECTKVFVGGLDPNLDEMEIREYFSRFGKIETLELPFDREKNQRRGFCFISFESSDAVETLCMSAKHNIGGKEVEVKKATPKGSRQVQPRSGGRGGGHGGGQGGGAPNAYGGGGGGWNAPGYPAPMQSYGGGYDYSAYYGQQPSYAGYAQQPSSAYSDPYGQAYGQSTGYDYSSWYGGANSGAPPGSQQPSGLGPYGRGQRGAGENRYQPY